MPSENSRGAGLPTTWLIRAGRNEKSRVQFLDPQWPVVAVGWCEQEDLSWLDPTVDAFKDAVAAYYPDYTPGSVRSAAHQLFRFVHKMRPGDYVVYPETSGGPVYCGRVQGAYEYREGNYPRHNSPIAPHVRTVAWLRALPRSIFTPEERADLSRRSTLFEIARESLLERCFPDRNPDSQPTADLAELDRRVGCLRARGGLSRPLGNGAPRRVDVAQATYERDPRVKAWVLQEAVGVCELCKQPAPFVLASGEPYLEVHHVRPLADGGPDTVENAVALCPNCHRRVHLGADAEALRQVIYTQVVRLVGA